MLWQCKKVIEFLADLTRLTTLENKKTTADKASRCQNNNAVYNLEHARRERTLHAGRVRVLGAVSMGAICIIIVYRLLNDSFLEVNNILRNLSFTLRALFVVAVRRRASKRSGTHARPRSEV